MIPLALGIGAWFRGIAPPRGVKRATIAVAHALLVIVYHVLKHPVEYRELAPDYFDKLNPERARRKLVKRLWVPRDVGRTFPTSVAPYFRRNRKRVRDYGLGRTSTSV